MTVSTVSPSRSCWVPTSVLWKRLCHGVTIKYFRRSIVVPAKADLIPPPPSRRLWTSPHPAVDGLPHLCSPTVSVTLSRPVHQDTRPGHLDTRPVPSVSQKPLSCPAGLLQKLPVPGQSSLLCSNTSPWPQEGRHRSPVTQLVLSLPGNCNQSQSTRESKLKVMINLKKTQRAQ